jgi:hypothetical protein
MFAIVVRRQIWAYLNRKNFVAVSMGEFDWYTANDILLYLHSFQSDTKVMSLFWPILKLSFFLLCKLFLEYVHVKTRLSPI